MTNPEEQTPTPAEPIKVDLLKLTLGDIPFIQRITTNQPYSIIEAIELMNRLVDGGVQHRSVGEYRRILSIIVAAVDGAINPKSTG